MLQTQIPDDFPKELIPEGLGIPRDSAKWAKFVDVLVDFERCVTPAVTRASRSKDGIDSWLTAFFYGKSVIADTEMCRAALCKALSNAPVPVPWEAVHDSAGWESTVRAFGPAMKILRARAETQLARSAYDAALQEAKLRLKFASWIAESSGPSFLTSIAATSDAAAAATVLRIFRKYHLSDEQLEDVQRLFEARPKWTAVARRSVQFDAWASLSDPEDETPVEVLVARYNKIQDRLLRVGMGCSAPWPSDLPSILDRSETRRLEIELCTATFESLSSSYSTRDFSARERVTKLAENIPRQVKDPTEFRSALARLQNPLGRWIVSLQHPPTYFDDAVTRAECAACLVMSVSSIVAYYRLHRRMPKALKDVVSVGLLPSVPIDPSTGNSIEFTGESLHCFRPRNKPTRGGFQLNYRF